MYDDIPFRNHHTFLGNSPSPGFAALRFNRTCSGERTTELIVIKRERLAEQHTPKQLDRDRLERSAASVGGDYINAIEDPCVRVFFRLRFLHGMSWKEVAAVAGCGKTGAAVRDACLRYLDTHLELS